MSRPYMRFFGGDYLKDTVGVLTSREHGPYLMLLWALWNAGGKLPDDDAILARHAQCVPAEWRRVRPILMPFFKVSRGRISQKRIDKELAHFAKVSAERRDASKKAIQKKRAKTMGKAAPIGEPNGQSIGPDTRFGSGSDRTVDTTTTVPFQEESLDSPQVSLKVIAGGAS